MIREFDLDKIHRASINILENTGVKFHSSECIKILKSNGIKVENNVAFFKEEQIMKYLKICPSNFIVKSKNSKNSIHLGVDNSYYGPGYGAAGIRDLLGNYREANLEDYINFLKLTESSKHLSLSGGILVEANELEEKLRFPIMFYEALCHSEKILVSGSGGKYQTKNVLDMLEIVCGDKIYLNNNYHILLFINTTSPLQFDSKPLETFLINKEYNQPLIITPASMAGSTSPITLAGTIAMNNAEVLAGIAMVQMIREGTPVIYGFQTSRADMQTGAVALGDPGTNLCIKYGAELAKYYGLPSRGGGANTDSKALTIQSAYEAMMALYISRESGMNLIIHAVGMLDGNGCMSYEKFIMDLEVIEMIENYSKGFEINDDTLALDLIKDVGIGGCFLNQEHTMKYCRKEPYIPQVSYRGFVPIGETPHSIIEKNIKKKYGQLMENYQMPYMEKNTKVMLEKYLKKDGIFS